MRAHKEESMNHEITRYGVKNAKDSAIRTNLRLCNHTTLHNLAFCGIEHKSFVNAPAILSASALKESFLNFCASCPPTISPNCMLFSNFPCFPDSDWSISQSLRDDEAADYGLAL